MKRARPYLLVLFKGLAKMLYAPLKLLPQQNKVIFISRKNSHNSIDFILLIKHLNKVHPSTKIVVLNHKMDNRLYHMFQVIKEAYHLATSKACIIDSYIISVSILRHKKGLIIVQIWHALGAIKNFGRLAVGRPAGNPLRLADIMNMHSGYTYTTVGGNKSVDIFAKAYGMNPKNILPIGMPRDDYLLSEKQKAKNITKIFKAYPKLKDKKIILYAPTFRKRSNIKPQELINALKDKPDYQLIIKQHPQDKTKLNINNNVIVDSNFDILELMHVAKFIVTDYSAVVFEAALINLPIFLWNYDYEEYSDKLGFAMEYPGDIPAVVTSKNATIIARNIINYSKKPSYSSFKDNYINCTDGNSTGNIVKLLRLP
jgi:CDP-ribitol ribitolphosphotransferase